MVTNNESNSPKEMQIDEFISRLHNLMIKNPDFKFAFLIGAGCSISSGIDGAGELVKKWLLQLKEYKKEHYEKWLEKNYPDYDKSNLSLIYARIIEDVFTTSQERQKEIEKITEGKDPGFGYCVLSQILTHEEYGRHCNVVLTVNFDDLIADALYLYTNKKPLVISHEALVGFVRIATSRPIILKLHGDAKLEPKNTLKETKELDDEVKDVLEKLFNEMGLIIIGYGGNDISISKILNNLSKNSFPWGVYWITDKIPDSSVGNWFINLAKERNDVIWVKHKDFDRLMISMKTKFGIKHPNIKDRFSKLYDTYSNTFKQLESEINKSRESESQIVVDAMDKASIEFDSWI